MTVSEENIPASNTMNFKIRKLNLSFLDRSRYIHIATISVFVGRGTAGYADGLGTAAALSNPQGMAADSNGNIYLADCFNYMVRKITPSGFVTTLAGSVTLGVRDGTGTTAAFNCPIGVTVDASLTVFVVELYGYKVRKISSKGVVTTIAGSGIQGCLDGTGTNAQFYNPVGVDVDSNGNLFVSDYNAPVIRMISSSGVVRTIAGKSALSGTSDGTGTNALFYLPWGVVADSSVTLYVSDYYSVRKVTSVGQVTTIVAGFTGLSALSIDPYGFLYVVNYFAGFVHKISPAGAVSRFAGNGGSTYTYYDNSMYTSTRASTDAALYGPRGVVVDGKGSVYVTSYAWCQIYKISTYGMRLSMFPALFQISYSLLFFLNPFVCQKIDF